jgi:hypothetical protein
MSFDVVAKRSRGGTLDASGVMQGNREIGPFLLIFLFVDGGDGCRDGLA